MADEKKYFSLITDIGAEKMLAAVQSGKKVNLINFAVGDGDNEMYYEPTTDQTELKHEVWRGYVTEYEISPESENVIIIKSVCPHDAGGFTVREMAVFDDEGDMIAVCNTPDTQKVKVTDGVVHELDLAIEVALTNKETTELIIDPHLVVATKEDIEELNARIDEISGGCSISYDDENGGIIVTSGGGGGGGGYVLQPATATRLGGVKIGETVNVTEDGIINVDAEKAGETAAEIVSDDINAISQDDIKNIVK